MNIKQKLILIFSAMLFSISASAGSPSNCFMKKEQGSCEDTGICMWVKQHETAQGKTIKGFCRVMSDYGDNVAKTRLRSANSKLLAGQ